MTTSITEPLSREQQIQSLETCVPKELLTSLGGVDNVLETIPQNNNFAHPTSELNEWFKALSFEKINPKTNLEISISENFVIFLLRREITNSLLVAPLSLFVLSNKGSSCTLISPIVPIEMAQVRKIPPSIIAYPVLTLSQVIEHNNVPISLDSLATSTPSSGNRDLSCSDDEGLFSYLREKIMYDDLFG